MPFYDHQLHYGATFRERVGDPQEFDAALGKVVESFSFLEGSLRNLVSLFLGTPNDIGAIVTAELSYKGLLHLAASLFKHKFSRGDFAVDGEDPAERFKELMALCFSAEEHRNRIIHSTYVADRFRVKTTAKAKAGLTTTVESVSADKLLDISDFIASVGMSVEELPIFLNMATRVEGTPGIVRYYDGDRLVAVFGSNYEE